MTVSRTVSASFRAARDTLRIVKNGRGAGTVTTEPAGIDCGSTCDYAFRRGTQVTLRATAIRHSHFRAWGGACSGKQLCALTISAPTDLTATFDNCAAAAFSGFNASTRHALVIVRLSLADRATARVRLLRGKTTLRSRTFANLTPGPTSLRLTVPSRAGAGRARVEVRLRDICGHTRTLSRVVTLH